MRDFQETMFTAQITSYTGYRKVWNRFSGRFGGNDKYLCHEFSQGTCVFGVGVLTDNDGDDFYSGLSSNQGLASLVQEYLTTLMVTMYILAECLLRV